MKRKIRKKRQIRLQKFKKQKERDKYDSKWWAKVLIEMFDSHPYWISASLPYYAFIYVDMHYGWEFKHPVNLFFLYDRMSQDIKYGLFWLKHPEALDDYNYKTYFKELGSKGFEVKNQVQVPVYYKGELICPDLRLDLIVDNRIILELKSVVEYKKLFEKQLYTYLRLMNCEMGYVINFNTDNITDEIYPVFNNHCK